MCRSAIAVVAIFLACVMQAATVAAQTEVVHEGSRITPRIVNGLMTAQYPSVGALLSGRSIETATLACSGTLIGCQTFLTAAHCVCEATGLDCQRPGAMSTGNLFVFFQHAGFFRVASIAVHPDYGLADDATGDLAVLTLAMPVTGIAPTPIDAAAGGPTSGSAGTIVGFGSGGGRSIADAGLKRVGSVTTAACSANLSSDTSLCWKFNLPLGNPGSNSNTCYGDSGGPLFVDSGAGETLAGVTSGGTNWLCQTPDTSYDAKVARYQAWIREQGGLDLDNTTCGSIPQVGDPKVSIVAASDTLSVERGRGVHTFEIPSGKSLVRVAINAVDNYVTDFDLYVEYGRVPTSSSFDCRTKGPGQYGFCEFRAPLPGTWYVAVERKKGFGPYQVTVTAFGTDCSDPANDGAPCDDNNPCTQDDTCQNARCDGVAPPPLQGCQRPYMPRRGNLILKDGATADSAQLSWSWAKGTATNVEDFGDPLHTTDYALCMFGGTVDAPALMIGKLIPAGGSCSGRACWKRQRSGFMYFDRKSNTGGIRAVTLRQGTDGKARVLVEGRGAHLSLPPLPLQPSSPVRVQLSNGVKCWEAAYSTSITNAATEFKAKPD